MMKMKLILASLLLFSITSIQATEDPKPIPTDSKELADRINEHVVFLKKSGVTLQQLKAKYASIVATDDCAEAAFEFGSKYEDELYAWAATDLFYEFCMYHLGGGLNTSGDENY